MKYQIQAEKRHLITAYKHAYRNLRLSHEAMLEASDVTTEAGLSAHMLHYQLVDTANSLAAQLPHDVVAAIEASIDPVFVKVESA